MRADQQLQLTLLLAGCTVSAEARNGPTAPPTAAAPAPVTQKSQQSLQQTLYQRLCARFDTSSRKETQTLRLLMTAPRHIQLRLTNRSSHLWHGHVPAHHDHHHSVGEVALRCAQVLQLIHEGAITGLQHLQQGHQQTQTSRSMLALNQKVLHMFYTKANTIHHGTQMTPAWHHMHAAIIVKESQSAVLSHLGCPACCVRCCPHLAQHAQLVKDTPLIDCKVVACTHPLHQRHEAPEGQCVIIQQQQERQQQVRHPARMTVAAVAVVTQVGHVRFLQTIRATAGQHNNQHGPTKLLFLCQHHQILLHCCSQQCVLTTFPCSLQGWPYTRRTSCTSWEQSQDHCTTYP